MTEPPAPPSLTRYLSALNRALQPLPADVRAEIVREIEGHLFERLATQDLETTLTAMGAPDALARPYLEDYQMNTALNQPNPVTLTFTVLNRAGRSAIALTAGTFGALLYLLAAAFAAIAVLKPITPSHVGWWMGPNLFEFGAIYGTQPLGQERLGYWIIPVAVIAAVGCYLAATAILKLAGRGLLAARR